MKRVSILFAVLLTLEVTAVWAQKPAATPANAVSLGEVKPTSDMWFYEQAMRQYQDPKFAVRKAAEFRAEQRERRLAAMQWYGLSNLRPRASSDPFHDDYAPQWTSNNSYYPNRWSVNGSVPVVAVHCEADQYGR